MTANGGTSRMNQKTSKTTKCVTDDAKSEARVARGVACDMQNLLNLAVLCKLGGVSYRDQAGVGFAHVAAKE